MMWFMLFPNVILLLLVVLHFVMRFLVDKHKTMAKPKNKGNNLKKHSKKPPMPGNSTTNKRKREDSDDDNLLEGNNVQKASHQHKKKRRVDNSYDENSTHVQVRQKVSHKRTFYFLEQLIQKHNMIQACPSMHIKEVSYGLDISFTDGIEAKKLVDFFPQVLPVECKQSKNIHSIEIAPVWKDDLICLPQRLYNSMGQMGPLVICYKVNASIWVVDPFSLKLGEIPASYYFQKEKSFRALFTKTQLIEFTVMEVEESEKRTKSGMVCCCKCFIL